MQKLSLDGSAQPINEFQADNVGPSSSFQANTRTFEAQPTVDFSNQNFNTAGSPTMKRSSSLILGILIVIAIGAGVATGFGGYKLKAKTSGSLTGVAQVAPIQQVAGDKITDGEVFGIQDEKTFNTNAEGYLEEGGIGGEGSHKLLRVGGVSQTVVLTSSATDLSKLVGMNVKVWGETFKAQKAGWLMDVGRIQVISTKGQPPAEE